MNDSDWLRKAFRTRKGPGCLALVGLGVGALLAAGAYVWLQVAIAAASG